MKKAILFFTFLIMNVTSMYGQVQYNTNQQNDHFSFYMNTGGDLGVFVNTDFFLSNNKVFNTVGISMESKLNKVDFILNTGYVTFESGLYISFYYGYKDVYIGYKNIYGTNITDTGFISVMLKLY